MADEARARLDAMLDRTGSLSDVVITDRAGTILARSGP
ncbi:hypothetical protein Rumeso_01698 [Rubellimicrobium mesophilum DSM 19309]|uniref:Roadblock/LAMTOR2 domain-containing protein n=1 Tax=Rubellimicrobium mesophilum DSM 19309 TaxID=442562 RepID=A0A017HQY3_9RHOB|nr:hypothetical protein Rumeso_01698 [Rubellimicrobium mesophilum DSM 19309]